MGKIIVSENVTLDGVVEDPIGDQGFRHGGWGAQLGDGEREQWAQVFTEEALAAEALLIGRRSDEWFAGRFRSRSGQWADRLNSMPKYVVSTTLKEPKWGNSTVLRGDVVNSVSELKNKLAGDIVVYASTGLARTLMEHDLVDELRLMVFPLGSRCDARAWGG